METIRIHEVKQPDRAPRLPALLQVWEASVRATHHFLSDAEVKQIRDNPYNPLEYKLLEYGIREQGVREVTVNEQNPQAVGFYEHMGFETYQRTACDEEGNPYPLLYMKLK